MSEMYFHCFYDFMSTVVDAGKYICGKGRERQGTPNSCRITPGYSVRLPKQNTKIEVSD